VVRYEADESFPQGLKPDPFFATVYGPAEAGPLQNGGHFRSDDSVKASAVVDARTTAGQGAGATHRLLADEAAGDGVEDAVEEIDGLGGAVAAANLERLIDDNGEGRGFEADELGNGQVLGDGVLSDDNLALAQLAQANCPEHAIDIEET